jgi:hypothetical protein
MYKAVNIQDAELPSISDIVGLMRTPDEVNDLEVDQHYHYEIVKSDQRFVCVAANHSKDPNDPQYDLLERLVEKFISEVDPGKSLIVTEGYQRDLSNINSTLDAIERGSEGHFVAYIASKSGISSFCPEPNIAEVTNEVAKKYPRKIVAFQWFCIYADGWHRRGVKHQIGFEEYVMRSLDYDKECLGWEDVDFTVAGMARVFEELFPGQTFDYENGQLFYDMVNPFNDFAITNEISREIDIIRDSITIQNIIKYWNQGYNLFMPFGTGHILTQEPALRRFLV